MATNDVIEALKVKAKESPAANAVFHMWAIRQRARHSVTVTGLSAKMKAEGFTFKDDEYRDLLSLLSRLNLGRLEKGPKGKVWALRELKTSLQSIGNAAVSGTGDLKAFRQRNRFARLTTPAPAAVLEPKKGITTGEPIRIMMQVANTPVEVSLPSGATAQEIAGIIARFQEVKAS